jgi:hypothetical protein
VHGRAGAQAGQAGQAVMRRLGTAALVLFIAVCALVTAARIIAWSHSPAVQLPANYAPGPLVPDTTSPTAATSARPSPRRTVTTWTTVTVPPARTATGEDGA